MQKQDEGPSDKDTGIGMNGAIINDTGIEMNEAIISVIGFGMKVVNGYMDKSVADDAVNGSVLLPPTAE